MSARTPNQQVAIDVAMAIARRSPFTLLDVQWMHEPTRSAIAAQVARRNDTTLAQIAAAYPGLPIELEGGRMHCHTGVLRIAVEVVIRIIQDVYGVNPAHGEQGDRWMFLGRMLSRDDHTPVNIWPGLINDESELVDLFATEDGRLLAIDASSTATSTVDEIRRLNGLGSKNPHLREAARRHRITSRALRLAQMQQSQRVHA